MKYWIKVYHGDHRVFHPNDPVIYDTEKSPVFQPSLDTVICQMLEDENENALPIGTFLTIERIA